jgi:hypothetical protein
MSAPPINVGMIKAMIAIPRALYLPAHQVPNHTLMNATPALGS